MNANKKRQLKLKLIELYGYKCSQCGVSGEEVTLTLEHIIKVRDGGLNEISNLRLFCENCQRMSG